MTHRAFISLALVYAVLNLTGCSTMATQTAATTPSSAQAGDTTVVAIAPPASPTCSIYDLLGIKQMVACTHTVRDCVAARLGMLFPGLEPTPALKLIADPENMAADAPPTVKTAAEIKQKEDQAAQKIKGIRYLATIGCGGCYAGVEDALLASLEDCTEEVRYETAVAIRKTVGRECRFCSEKACCSEKIQKKLTEMNEVDAYGCYNEPSDRVRRQARLALRSCGPVQPVIEEVETNGTQNGGGDIDIEGPGAEDVPASPSAAPVEEKNGTESNELIPAPPQASFQPSLNRFAYRLPASE